MALYRVKPVFDDESFDYTYEVHFALEAFKEYIQSTSQTINSIKEKIKKDKELLARLENEEREYFFDYVDHEISLFTHQLYFTSLFISLYSFLEKKMSQICKAAEKKQNLKVKDLSGEGVFKYNNYIKKVLNINVDHLNAEWSQIIKFNKLRNILVHNPTNSIFQNGEKSRDIEILKNIKHLTLTQNDDVIEFEISDKELLVDFYNVIAKFLHDVYYQKEEFR